MAGLKTATGEEIDGSFELRVEVEEEREWGQGRGQNWGQGQGQGEARVLTLCVTGDVTIGELLRRIVDALGAPRPSADRALWWEQRRRWLLSPSPTLDALGVGGGSRLRFAPRHRPLRLRLPHGGVLRARLDCAATPGRAVAALCGLLGLPHPEELSLLWPEQVGEGRDPPPAPPRPGPDTPEASWLDVGRSLLEQGVAEEQELELRFKYPCALGEPQPGLHSELLQAQALGSVLSEEMECSEEQGLRFAALQYLTEGPEWGEGRDPQDPPEPPPDLEAALEELELSLGGGATPGTPGPGEELGAPPELDEELEILRGSPWPFRGSRPARAALSGSSLSLWSPPSSGGPQQVLNLRGCEVTPQVDLGAQKFHIKLGVPPPGGGSETLLRCRDAPQFSCWLCSLQAASGWGSPSSGWGSPSLEEGSPSLGEGSPSSGEGSPSLGWGSPSPTALRAQIRGVLGVLGVQPDRGDPPGTPAQPPPDPRRLLPPRLQRRIKGKEFPQLLLRVLLREGPLSPPQARLRFLQAWRALPGFGLGVFIVRFRGAPRDEALAVGLSRLLRLPLGSGGAARSWRQSELRQWDVNWDSGQVRLWLSGDVTLGLRVLSAPPRVLHQFLGGALALGGPPRDPRELQRLLEGGLDP